MLLPFAEIGKQEEDWILGRGHGYSLEYVEFEGSLRFQSRGKFWKVAYMGLDLRGEAAAGDTSLGRRKL